MTKLPYRPEIDGLRALAVVPVVLFHLGTDWLPGGFLGVDVFFVISGFLITSILKAELLAGEFSLRAFWGRRVRRILPALSAVIGAVLVTSLFVYKPDRVAVAAQAVAALTSLANLYFWRESGDYWGPRAEQAPLLHTWSLSVEEQFYLLFPILLWLVFRSAPHRLPQAVGSVIALAVPLFFWGAARHPTATFYLLPTRAWELAVGCLLATAAPAPLAAPTGPPPSAGSSWTPRSLSASLPALAGLAAIFLSYAFVPRLGPAVIGTVLGAALVITFGRHGIANALLTNRVALHLGTISYSLYLWHWPVLVFADYFRFGRHKGLLLAPIYLLALGSYYLVERPARRGPARIAVIAAAWLIVLVGAVALSQSDPFYDTSSFAEAWWIPNDCNPHAELDGSGRNLVFAATRRLDRPVPPDAYLRGGLIFGDGDGPPEIVLLGDSHASMWSETIVRIAARHRKKVSVWAMDGVSPFLQIPPAASPGESASGESVSGESELTAGEQRAYYASLVETISAWKPRLVIVSTIWMRRTEAEVDDLIEFLDRTAAKTLLIEQPPVLEHRDRNVMQHLAYLGVEPADSVRRYLPIDHPEQSLAGSRLIRNLAERFAGVDVVPTWDLFTRDTAPDSEALALDGRNVVYLDEDHLLHYGTELASPRLEQAILAAFSTPSDAPR